MDLAIVPDSSPKQGDIDIFLFSNGQVFSPPRKYHLTAEELNYWSSTLNFLARSHYGYLHSSIDLYTIDGKKVETPLELSNNNAYVAVECNDSFQPGGYDQYLMKASKSWIKRYGSISSTATSKEKLNTAITGITEHDNTNNPKFEKLKDVKEIKETEENSVEVTKTATVLTTEINKLNEKPGMTKPSTNVDEPKQGEKKRTSIQRSSVIKKNISNIQASEKKASLPQKKRPGSPPKKNTINKTIPPKKESLGIKTLYSPVKSKMPSSQLIVKSSSPLGTDVNPEFIIPAKLIKTPESDIQSEPVGNAIKTVEQDIAQAKVKQQQIGNEIKTVEQDVDYITKNQQHSESLKQILYPKDDFIQDASTRQYSENVTSKRNTNTDTLETITEINNDKSNKKLHGDVPTKNPLSTETKCGDVINLRLNIELEHNVLRDGVNKDNTKQSLPLVSDFLNIRIPLQEKSSQVNIDEIVFQKETMKSILEELNRNKVVQNYMILRCECCCYCPDSFKKSNEDKANNETKAINKNNKDYIVLLPYIKPYDDFFGCKCDETIIKFDKFVQTSITIESIDHPKVASFRETIDQCTNMETTVDGKSISLSRSHISVCDQACGSSKVVSDDNKVTPPKENQDHIKCTVSKENQQTKILAPKESQRNSHVECPVCSNTPSGKNMSDHSTQTDSHCFLLEARLQKDGHYSFHLPPLHMVKLYRY